MKIKEKTTNKNNKNGISLIVLVITIIVMIILAAAVILSLSSNGIIDRANEAVDKTDEAQVKMYAQTLWTDAYLDGKRGAELIKVVESGLEELGITEMNYTIDISDSGMDMQKFDVEDWEFAYTYNQTTSTWSSKIRATDNTKPEGDIVVKFYNLGKTITPPSFEFNGLPFEFNPGNAYKMLVQGRGDMGAVMTTSGNNVTGASAWQVETALFMQKLPNELVIPYVTEAIIDEGVTNIGAYAFCGASSLKKVSIANSVQSIDEFAFMYSISLNNITIQENVKSIGNGAFAYCSSLESISILSRLDDLNMANNVFMYCDNLKIIHVPSKEQWNSMLISDGNDSVVDATVTYDYRTNVEMLANEGWQKAYDSGKKTQSALETAVSEYLEANEISSEELALYNIDVTTKGVNITAKTVTLSDTILSALDYGKTVNYNANGINDWKVLYKQTVDEEEYVYLIASEKVDGNKLPKNIPGAIISEDNIYWEWDKAPSVVASGTINSTRWLANWSDYGANENGRCVSYFLDENYWTAFKNTSKYGDNVVGAIGTPTLEMFATSYNKRSEALGDTSVIELIDGEYGYMIGENYSTNFSRTDSLYWWSSKDGTSVWVASPSDDGAYSVFYVDYGGGVGINYYKGTHYGLRPVVCLKSSIQARVGLSADSADIILK